MTENKVNIGIICGGKSPEHNISIESARLLLRQLDQGKFDLHLINITKEGKWLKHEVNAFLSSNHLTDNKAESNLLSIEDQKKLDVLFPIMHGPCGEDGAIQGLAKMLDIPCVGTGILGSSICLDKDVSKRLLRHAGLRVTNHLVVRPNENERQCREKVEKHLQYPVYVKPANLGSSIGIKKVDHSDSLFTAIETARQYDPKVVLEEAVVGRELEIAVIGNEKLKVSAVGEILNAPNHFYDFKAKYDPLSNVTLDIPAKLDSSLKEEIEQVACTCFRVLECSGFARIDLFLTLDSKIIVNEVNTIPGLTQSSMFPILWEEKGYSITEILTEMIELAMEK